MSLPWTRHNCSKPFSTPRCCADGGGTCTVEASYTLHNSLAYGADWCHLPAESNVSCAPPAADPVENLTERTGHLRIQYESPTASFDTSLEDEVGRYIPESSAAAPPTTSGAPSATCSSGETASESYLLASCSFYDHTLHLWRWDRFQGDAQVELQKT